MSLEGRHSKAKFASMLSALIGGARSALLKHSKLVRDVVQFDLKPLHDSNEFSGGFLFVRVQFNHALVPYPNFCGGPDGVTDPPL
jgi:hypothetical protein